VKPIDEVRNRPDAGAADLEPMGMFLWHLDRLLKWSAMAGMMPAVVRAHVKQTIAAEPRGVRPQRARKTRIPVSTRVRVFVRDQGRCRRCGSTRNLEIDHISPRSRGGSDDDDNLQILCGRCNRTKAARVPA
jgi:hypothetical protein